MSVSTATVPISVSTKMGLSPLPAHRNRVPTVARSRSCRFHQTPRQPTFFGRYHVPEISKRPMRIRGPSDSQHPSVCRTASSKRKSSTRVGVPPKHDKGHGQAARPTWPRRVRPRLCCWRHCPSISTHAAYISHFSKRWLGSYDCGFQVPRSSGKVLVPSVDSLARFASAYDVAE
jgi:hypothetical protein